MARAKTTIRTLSTWRTGNGLTMGAESASDEAGADLEKFLDLGQEFLVGDEDDQVVLGEHHGVVMRHDDLVAAHDCGYKLLPKVEKLFRSEEHTSELRHGSI